MSEYGIITITHKSLNINDLADYLISRTDDEEQRTSKLHALKEYFGFEELMYLSTCNRVMYIYRGNPSLCKSSFLFRFFQYINPGLDETRLSKIDEVAQLYCGDEAVRHAFEVVSSLDSMVVGEREIAQQFRQAYNLSKEAGLTGDSIRLLVDHAVPLAKKVFTHTKISQRSISVVNLAIKKILNSVDSTSAKILLIGAGQTNTMMAELLVKKGYTNFTIANRTVSKAESLAKQVNGKHLALTEIHAYNDGFDVLITCTGSTEPVVDLKLMDSLLEGQGSNKLVVDLAVPNDISATAATRLNGSYVAVENLREIAQANLAFRKEQLHEAEEIIHDAIHNFEVSERERQLEVAISDLPKKVKAVKSKAMDEVFKKELDALDPESKDLMEKMLTYMEKKYISIPMVSFKDALLKQKGK